MQIESPGIQPFPQNAQYQSAFKKDDEDADGKKSSTKKGAPKKKKTPKKRADVKNLLKEPAKQDDDVPAEYQANQYAKMRQDFIDRAKADRGLSFKDAALEWNGSSQKRKMLAGLSIPELRRRRFISKDCECNPWAEGS